MFRVDQCCVCRFGGVIPPSGSCLATAVLSSRDNLESFAFEFFVDFLPARQILTTPSPGSPGYDQDLLAAKLGKAHDPTLPIRHGKVRSDARLQKCTAKNRYFAKTPNAFGCIMDDTLPHLCTESRKVEVLPSQQVLRNRNTDIGATRTLWLQFETIHFRHVHFANPQSVGRLRIGQHSIERHCPILVQNGG